MNEAVVIFEGMAEIFRAGARKSRQWTYNNQAQVQAQVYDAMADEAEHQIELLHARHD